jgi:hypothetical protein
MTIQLNISDNFTDLVTKFNNLYALVDSDLDFRSKISAASSGFGSLSYSSATGVITYAGPSDADIRGRISVTDAGGDGSLTYNSSTGVITYTGINGVGGDGITISSGNVSLTTPTRFRVYDSAGTTVLDLYGSGSL